MIQKRKDDEPDSKGHENRAAAVDVSGVDQSVIVKLRGWQIGILCSMCFFAGIASVTYKLQRSEDNRRYEELKAMIAAVNDRKDQWTAGMMQTWAEYASDRNPGLHWPMPLDVQEGQRVRNVPESPFTRQ